MRIVPVLDLLNGVVVRGVAGRRSEYRPVVSRLVDRCEPLDVAQAFRSRLGLDTIYVADLDAILHQRPNWDVYRELTDEGFTLWIDSGLRNPATAEALLSGGASIAIVGLETWPGPAPLEDLCGRVGQERLIFSLDLRSGQPLGELATWNTTDPAAIASRAISAGIRRILVLDLAGVGVGGGVPALGLCRDLRQRHPDIEVITGGGVRNVEDLETLQRAGIAGALVASALHDGRWARQELDRFLLG